MHKRDVGETDRIYALYTLESGKIQALAKGVRKPQAKLAGSLENFTLADVTVMRTRGMGKITSSIVENNYSFLKKDYLGLTNALQSLRVFNRLVDLEHCDAQVFWLLQTYLSLLDETAKENLTEERRMEMNALFKLGFLFKLLNSLGYSLMLSSCACCGNALQVEEIYFSAEQGGVLCPRCRVSSRNITKINVNVAKILRFCVQQEFGLLKKLKIEKRDLTQAQRILEEFLLWIN